MPRSAVDVAVVGAGAFGLSTALRLARAGLGVRVLDRSSAGQTNASAVAAGMLAPVSETLAEGGSREHLRRLMLARDLWPAFAAAVPGLALDRSGVDYLTASQAAATALGAALAALGVQAARLPGSRPGVHLADDWRLDAPTALGSLRSALLDAGAEVEVATVSLDRQGRLLADGDPLEAERVVIAGGYGARALAPAVPELGVLRPIKGQLLAFAPSAAAGPTLRADAIYVAPQASGARAGATMEPGRDDVAVEAPVTRRLHAAALAVQPALAGLAYRGEAGVRAATPDGWPLVGPSATPGLFLAAGARRNGWLLAPLVSQMIADEITGGAPHPLGQAFHPGRFNR